MSQYLRMKLFAIGLLAVLACFALLPGVSSAAEGKELTIVYSGSVRGNFEPCHS